MRKLFLSLLHNLYKQLPVLNQAIVCVLTYLLQFHILHAHVFHVTALSDIKKKITFLCRHGEFVVYCVSCLQLFTVGLNKKICLNHVVKCSSDCKPVLVLFYYKHDEEHCSGTSSHLTCRKFR